MTKAELIDTVKSDCAKNGIEVSKKVVKAVLDSGLESIKNCVAGGEEILLQPLGRFTTKFRQERKATNMVTGEKLIVPAKYVPIFNASSELKEEVGKMPAGTK